MTPDDILAIRQRLAAATPGPWRAWPERHPSTIQAKTREVSDRVHLPADVQFIANAPADIEALLGLVERLLQPAGSEDIRTQEKLAIRTALRQLLDT